MAYWIIPFGSIPAFPFGGLNPIGRLIGVLFSLVPLGWFLWDQVIPWINLPISPGFPKPPRGEGAIFKEFSKEKPGLGGISREGFKPLSKILCLGPRKERKNFFPLSGPGVFVKNRGQKGKTLLVRAPLGGFFPPREFWVTLFF